MNKEILATITILLTDRQSNHSSMNQLLSENGHLIMARLGVNVQKKCLEHCTGLIVVAVEGEREKIQALTDSLNRIEGLKAELVVMAE
jgi:metal-responsive CopG/Arc/MetJ family transcriptional regulator